MFAFICPSEDIVLASAVNRPIGRSVDQTIKFVRNFAQSSKFHIWDSVPPGLKDAGQLGGWKYKLTDPHERRAQAAPGRRKLCSVIAIYTEPNHNAGFVKNVILNGTVPVKGLVINVLVAHPN